MTKVKMAGSLINNQNVLTHIRDLSVFTSKDMGENRGDAWLYGITVGWSKKAIKELAVKHNWSEEEITLMKSLNKQFNKLQKKQDKKESNKKSVKLPRPSGKAKEFSEAMDNSQKID